MVIVHVLNSLVLGGREKIVVDICNNIDSQKHTVFLITFTNDRNDIRSELHSDIKLINLPFKCDSALDIFIFWLTGLPKFIRAVNNIRPDIVHSHLYYHYYLFLSLGLRLSKVNPSSFRTVHTSGLFYASKNLANMMRVAVEQIATIIYKPYLISISKAVYHNNQSLFSSIVKGNRLIYNGVDLDLFSNNNLECNNKMAFGIKEDSSVITYVSRLDVGKNHDVLINAFSTVLKSNPTCVLCLLGDGVLDRELKEKVLNLGISEKVIFFGSINNVKDFLEITDIAVFPSRFEGFPISLIEELAMGLPVITSDIDIFKEILTDGVNGILCEVNNSEKLAVEIVKLINDKDKRLFLSQNAKKLSLDYSINAVVQKTQAYYDESNL